MIMANVHLLKGNFREAKHLYRECLQTLNHEGRKGEVLNNLAVASIKHLKALARAPETEKLEKEIEAAQKDAEFIASWLKQSIYHHEMQFEKDKKRKVNISKTHLLHSLLTEEEQMTMNSPSDLAEHNEQSYYNVLESPKAHIAIENLTEYLLEYLSTLHPKGGESISESQL